MYYFVYILSVLYLLLPSTSLAGSSDIELPSDYTQSQFEDLSRQAGLAISFTPLAPAEPLGIVGFDIGIAVTVVDIDENEDFWEDAVEDADVPSAIVLPRIHAQKGLPFGVDVGLAYAKTPVSNVALIGAEVKWAFLTGGVTYPAVALRGSFTKLLGVGDFDLETYGVDLSISKGFSLITPYAGIGQVWISSEEDTSAVDLEKESVSATKGFVGIKVSFFLASVVAEADFSEIPLYSLRVNIGY